MQTIDYWAALSLWWSGQSTSGFRMALLWEWPMLYWGRMGKLLQFTGGLMAIIDIIGPDRLNSAGKRYFARSKVLITPPTEVVDENGTPTPAAAAGKLWQTVFRLVFLATMAIGALAVIRLVPEDTEVPVLVTAGTVAALFLLQYVLPVFALLFTPRVIVAGAVAAGGIAMVAGGTHGVAIGLTVMCTAVALPLARLLEGLLSVLIQATGLSIAAGIAFSLAKTTGFHRDNHPARWIAFGLVCIGFHFDLLAS